MNSENSVELGRAANVARLMVGMPLDPDPLLKLLDATLAGMAVTGFVLSGIEYVDGCAHAQFWCVSTLAENLLRKPSVVSYLLHSK